MVSQFICGYHARGKNENEKGSVNSVGLCLIADADDRVHAAQPARQQPAGHSHSMVMGSQFQHFHHCLFQ